MAGGATHFVEKAEFAARGDGHKGSGQNHHQAVRTKVQSDRANKHSMDMRVTNCSCWINTTDIARCDTAWSLHAARTNYLHDD